MSKEVLELKGITFDGLMALKYGDELKDKFKELGVPQVWKGGVKKITMVEQAIELLSKGESGQQIASVLSEDLIEVSIIDADTEEVLGDYVVEEAIVEEVRHTAESPQLIDVSSEAAKNIKEIIKKLNKVAVVPKKAVAPYSLEVIDFNLKNIQSNLNNGIPAQRNILLKKLTKLEAIKKEFYS